jgi:hypothetical protein
MLSQETLQRYRQMTPGERLRLALSMQDENEKWLLYGKVEVVRRKFQLLRNENDARNYSLLRAFGLDEQMGSHDGR